MTIKRLALLLSAALLALAVTAGTASAAVVDANGNYTTSDDTIFATTPSATLTGLVTITCAGTASGTLTDGDPDANTGTRTAAGIKAVTFQNCTPTATVAVQNLPYSVHVTETDLSITSAVSAHIDAATFTCTASAAAGVVVGDVDWTATTIRMDETLQMSGVGCGLTANWTALYTTAEDLEWQ